MLVVDLLQINYKRGSRVFVCHTLGGILVILQGKLLKWRKEKLSFIFIAVLLCQEIDKLSFLF